MCGFAGFIGYSMLDAEQAKSTVKRMGDALIHRGPDSTGTWCDHTAEVALTHRRLSIIDLSPNGHQPMRSASGRFVIAFNGEIYNHFKLRDRLTNSYKAAIPWKGSSDTETLLMAIETWGVKKTLEQN